MKALVLRDVGKINIEDVQKPELKPGEVLVKVKACGVCGSDIPRAYKDGAHNMPLIIGHELAGEVTEVGKEAEEKWIGKRVGVFPLVPCMNCQCCKIRKYEMCKNYSYLGSRRDGGFGEYVAVPQWNLIELPEKVDYSVAAMLEPMAVAVHAIRRVNPTSEEKVAVMGLGTIGLFVTMFLKDMGIKNVYTIGNKEFQKKKVVELGIEEDHYCDIKSQDVNSWIEEKTAGLGVDVFFECVGKQESYQAAVDHVAPLGRVCLVGNPESDMSLDRNIYWKILRNQLTVTGTWNSSFTHDKDDDWHYVLDRLQQGKIKPEGFITQRYNLENIIEGFQLMRDKKEDYIKVMAAESWDS